MTSFSVVAIMKESESVIRRFIDYYGRRGASRVMIYLDDPASADTAARIHTDYPGIADVTVCDAAFWSENGPRPEEIQPRSSAVYAHAHARCESDWLLVVDADEFVIDRIPLSEFLDRVPAHIVSLGIRPAEAVWGPGDDIDVEFGSTWFRRPSLDGGKAFRIYGPWGAFLRGGIIGHTIGKQFLRKRADVDLIDCHVSLKNGRSMTVFVDDIDPALSVVELAHFDAVGFDRWLRKFRRRVRSEPVQAMKRRSGRRQIQHKIFALCDRLGPKALRYLFRRMYALSPRQARALDARGHAFQVDLFGPGH